MQLNMVFIINSTLLGVGLAMDAFSVSLANGLNEPLMKKGKMCLIAGMFAFMQALMPMIGWICVHTLVAYFTDFEKYVPWIALILLCFIGGKMLWDGIRGETEEVKTGLGAGALIVQGIATSIDALSVGFTIAKYNLPMALMANVIIAAVTFILSIIGIVIGKKVGTRFAGKATIIGGLILIGIGIEIFVKR